MVQQGRKEIIIYINTLFYLLIQLSIQGKGQCKNIIENGDGKKIK